LEDLAEAVEAAVPISLEAVVVAAAARF